MAISKRMRFEILRRDSHTCRYCGRSAPDVKLTVDHVLPTSLGGTDDPNNLVTACAECNSGKSSTSPDSELVADIDNHALLMQASYAKAVKDRNKKRTHVGKNLTAALKYWDDNAQYYSRPSSDAKGTLRYFFKMGITLDDVEEAMDIALSKYGIQASGRWPYFCGIIRNHVRKLEESAKAIFTEDHPELKVKEPCGHCDSCRDSTPDECWLAAEVEPDEEPYSCQWCGSHDCMFDLGVQLGLSEGWRQARGVR